MSGRVSQNIALLAVTVLIMLAAIEVGLRLLVEPAELAYGTLFGRELPPQRIVSESEIRDQDKADKELHLVDGVELSRGDLWGRYRPDPLLGYAPLESAVSKHGWWQSNSLGARAREDVTPAVAAGKRRMLVFGESFAHGSRLPQEQAWPNMIDAAQPALEVLNFAVDGYGMGQSLVRYRQIRQLLEYDIVLLMLVPELDLWRDINVVRWGVVVPRFVLEDGDLKLVAPPPSDPVHVQDGDCISAELHAHLLRHDRFYLPAAYCSPPLIGRSILYKLAVNAWSKSKNRRLRAGLMDPGSEALQVSKAIFAAMQREAEADGAVFRLVILPSRHKWRALPHVQAWQDMVSFICADGVVCIDLLDVLRHVPVDEIDYAYDGSHYGPGTNARIASAIADALKAMPANASVAD